jgi:hypothetical protein
MMRRDFHQHMDMFSRDKTPETTWTPSSLQTCHRSYPLPQRDFLHLVAILRDDKLCQMAT